MYKFIIIAIVITPVMLMCVILRLL